MVKIPNEALLIGGALVAALVLFKSGRNTPGNNTPININPFTSFLDKAQTQAIEVQESNIDTLQNVKQSNIGIAQQILNYERNLADLAVSKINTELDKTRSFISQLQKVRPGSTFGINTTGKSLLRKFDSEFAFYQERWTGEKGRLSQKSLFPDLYVPFSQATRAAFAQQAKYETAQQQIKKASDFSILQQNEINRLNANYENTYGDISRYS